MVATESKIQPLIAPRPLGPAAGARSTPSARETAAQTPRARETDRVEISGDAAPGAPTKPNGEPLSDDERRKLEEMKQRDAEVRAHEQAHVAAAGRYFRGGPTYETEKGPDGKDYVVAGSVSIDSDPVPNDPEATIAKMQQVRRAALAPAEPSSTDRRVAAQASQAEAKARQELAEQRAEEQGRDAPKGAPADASADLAPEFETGYTARATSRSLELPRLIDVAA
jgi:hypothetical protein